MSAITPITPQALAAEWYAAADTPPDTTGRLKLYDDTEKFIPRRRKTRSFMCGM